jgi:hypothetical protein
MKKHYGCKCNQRTVRRGPSVDVNFTAVQIILVNSNIAPGIAESAVESNSTLDR